MKYQYKFYTYIMSSISGVLYIGITNHLEGRVHEHKTGKHPDAFSKRYNVTKLVYYEEYDSVYDAIGSEKQLKGWRREKKLNLMRTMNEKMIDLAWNWGTDFEPSSPSVILSEVSDEGANEVEGSARRQLSVVRDLGSKAVASIVCRPGRMDCVNTDPSASPLPLSHSAPLPPEAGRQDEKNSIFQSSSVPFVLHNSFSL